MFLVQDEARFGRITRCSRCWAPTGIRPCVPQQIIRQYLSVFTAVAPQSGKMISLIFPTSNAEIMTLFLKHVSQQFPGFFLVMQVDGAGWHRSHKVQIPENMRLLFQPPYSPELNPVEHIWDDIREKYFHNCQFPSLDALQERLCTAINELSSKTGYVRSMTYFPHIHIALENAS